MCRPRPAFSLPVTAADVSELPIVAGDAAHTVAAAVANLVGAVVALERIAMACARALDATANKDQTS
jgi:hypothetical protein